MLTLDAVEFRQGDFRLRADLTVGKGATVAIIGPSGGGKSTLLNCIGGYEPVNAGRVVWDGVDMAGLAPGDRPISLVFQDNNLFPHMTAFDNVAIGIRPDLRLAAAETEQVRAALAAVGLADLALRKPAHLSGGQQSRVALARVLVRRKPLLLLDEPFAALGPALRGEMLDLVAEMVVASGATLLIVTHDPADAKRMAAQTVFVEDGIVHRPVATEKILADPPAALADYLGL